MASPREWCSRGALIPFSITAILCTAFCLNIIYKPSYQKNGFITLLVRASPLDHIILTSLQFDFTNINARGVPLSIPTNPVSIPGVVSTAVSQVGSVAATAASSIASEAQSAVSSAITAVETAIESIIPMNGTLGVKYFCLGFTNHIDCKELPLNLSIKVCLIIGALFAILAIFPDVISICSLLARRLGLISFSWIPAILAPLRIICSAICCISIIVLTIILYGLLSMAKSLPKQIVAEAGEACNQVLAALTCAIFMGISTIAGLFFGSLL
jgi:hypothetical protein